MLFQTCPRRHHCHICVPDAFLLKLCARVDAHRVEQQQMGIDFVSFCRSFYTISQKDWSWDHNDDIQATWCAYDFESKWSYKSTQGHRNRKWSALWVGAFLATLCTQSVFRRTRRKYTNYIFAAGHRTINSRPVNYVCPSATSIQLSRHLWQCGTLLVLLSMIIEISYN